MCRCVNIHIKNKSFLLTIYHIHGDKRHLKGNKKLKIPTVKIVSYQHSVLQALCLIKHAIS